MKLIAEFCQNHNGNREILKSMIDAASASGFTHAKIQALYSNELVFRQEFEIPESSIYRPYEPEFKRLNGLDLTHGDEIWFVQECLKQGLTPMITVFSHSGVERARNAGFSSVKIASYDCASLPLIRKVSNFAHEIVISTGATTWDDVIRTSVFLDTLKDYNMSITLLHARTIYPTPSNETGLSRMLALKDFGFPFGFSDHSKPEDDGLLASYLAIFLGASALERHFTVLERSKTKDGPVSITQKDAEHLKQFSQMTKKEQILFLGESLNRMGEFMYITSLDPTELERRNASYYRGRVASRINGLVINSWEELPNFA